MKDRHSFPHLLAAEHHSDGQYWVKDTDEPGGRHCAGRDEGGVANDNAIWQPQA